MRSTINGKDITYFFNPEDILKEQNHKSITKTNKKIFGKKVLKSCIQDPYDSDSDNLNCKNKHQKNFYSKQLLHINNKNIIILKDNITKLDSLDPQQEIFHLKESLFSS